MFTRMFNACSRTCVHIPEHALNVRETCVTFLLTRYGSWRCACECAQLPLPCSDNDAHYPKKVLANARRRCYTESMKTYIEAFKPINPSDCEWVVEELLLEVAALSPHEQLVVTFDPADNKPAVEALLRQQPEVVIVVTPADESALCLRKVCASPQKTSVIPPSAPHTPTAPRDMLVS